MLFNFRTHHPLHRSPKTAVLIAQHQSQRCMRGQLAYASDHMLDHPDNARTMDPRHTERPKGSSLSTAYGFARQVACMSDIQGVS